MLTLEEKRELLQVARQTLQDYFENKKLTAVSPLESLKEKKGAFVTLHHEGKLKGCIGHLAADEPLFLVIQKMAIAAATGDPRFPPVSPEELSAMDIEISVLSPFQEIHSVEEIVVGRDGLYVVQGPRRGLLLPQVATEWGWDPEAFLAQTCVKAGLPREVWKKGGVLIFSFTAEVFGEKTIQEEKKS
ncbi:MAG: AmmeMemoRadiSam system protein A [Deltaproteobacteria bacterium]|nr:AmmeMemoRadiSam system protein A [Deltaproteobacteria bacterium]